MLGSLMFLVQACTVGDLAAARPVTGAVERGDPGALTQVDRLVDGTGVGLCALSALSCAMPWIAWWDDARYVNISADALAFVALATLHSRPR